MAVAGKSVAKAPFIQAIERSQPPPSDHQSLGEKCAYLLTSWQKHPWICFNFQSFIASRLVVIDYLQCVHNVMQEMCIVKFCTIGRDPK